eukprot:TRINITY_DN20068_c0_g3_i1.p1 TRINITY_DN20068_c0_g3~~TRINITY_DN20068_c0_g3_i1.p1  ORF type:complete len:529 (-),score=201.67 TRINITY_DN20068_c0_g3_i1:39-1523(-)
MEEEQQITAAWGKRKDVYYDHDVKGVSKHNTDIEREEEEEVKRMRSERMALVDDELYEDDMLGSLIAKRKEAATASDSRTTLNNFGIEAVNAAMSSSATSAAAAAEDLQVEKLKKDLSSFSREEKLQYLEDSKPELFDLLEELEEKKSILENEIHPLLELVESRFPEGEDDPEYPAQFVQLVTTRKRLLLNFCGNVTFCLMMVAKGKSLQDHPVAEAMIKLDDLLKLSALALDSQQDILRKLIEQEEEETYLDADGSEDEDSEVKIEESVSSDGEIGAEDQDAKSEEGGSDDVEDAFVKKHDLKEILSNKVVRGSKKSARSVDDKLFDYLNAAGEESDGEEFSMLDKQRPVLKSTEAEFNSESNSEVEGDCDEDDDNEEVDLKNDKSEAGIETGHQKNVSSGHASASAVVGHARPDLDFTEGRRKITKTIMKNQGLKRYRKKANKNPRLKHRNKYEKALKKHRTLVRSYQGQATVYGGEATGIKPNLVKATRVP